jgi:hypothetical protein
MIKVKKIKDIKDLEDLHESNVNKGLTEPWKHAVIVYSQDSFKNDYTEQERSYLVGFEYNKYFREGMLGNGLFGSCLDGTDKCLRLNWLGWEVEKVYTCELISK